MKRKSLAGMQCSIAQALDVVGDPWTLLIVRDALAGVRRFDDFISRLGIPRTTLNNRLNVLVDAGVFERQQYQDHPPRHEYRPTEKGTALRPVLVALLQWGDEWSDLAEPPIVLVDSETDEPLELTYVDRRTGRTLDQISVKSRSGRPREGG